MNGEPTLFDRDGSSRPATPPTCGSPSSWSIPPPPKSRQ